MTGKPRIFIDGSSGTTGLRIYERLAGRCDIELVTIPDEKRKDPGSRAEKMNSSDVVFLCLPDSAAEEAVKLIDNPETVVIDASTAHRTAPGWVYGFPELHGQRSKIAVSKRIANPGCHAIGFVALIAPLVEERIISDDIPLDCFSLTGYSGGGKKMIAEYTDDSLNHNLSAPRIYGLSQNHKHLPEMKTVCGLKHEPVFCPVVGDYYSGMVVTVPLHRSLIRGDAEMISDIYRRYYTSGLVKFTESTDVGGFVSAKAFSGRDDMAVSVYGEENRIIVQAVFDNLGKGASGSAIQNMNIVLGFSDCTGLVTG
ncbi:MAG: N-acetyl-gamma-glutamyl-phosphate reductase [Clostridia bacterium]|nr:N-acetyl-gamma-glutamyl-phosphate reductase [Clostridia bacterium]